MSQKKNKVIDFGYKEISIDKKKHLVKDVFDKVASRYDFVNDISSFGLHRYWKNELIYSLAPQKHQVLADLAGGTGDIAKRFLLNGGGKADIIDINFNMIQRGLSKSISNNLRHLVGNCETIPIKDNTYDRVTIAFGLRNITYREKALEEIYRILKPGGRFMCLEFSHVENKLMKKLYDIWSFKFLPSLGELVSDNRKAYQYLVESIRVFPNQEELSYLMTKTNFSRVKYKNLSQGIVAIHSGWKI